MTQGTARTFESITSISWTCHRFSIVLCWSAWMIGTNTVRIGSFPNGVEVVVVFTEPAPDITRIVSARRATRAERKRYHEAIGY